MELIKRFLSDRVRVGISIVCLIMLSAVMVSSMTGETLAASTNVCVQCNGSSGLFRCGTSLEADDACPSGYHTYSGNSCPSTCGGSSGSTKTLTATFKYVNGSTTTKNCNYTSGSSCSISVPASVGGWGSSYTSTSCSSSTVTLTENTEYYECGVEVEIYLNAVGGSAASSYITRMFGDYYGGLPNATKDGYKFLGWYTEATGGSPVTSATKVTNYNDHTIYAHWAQGDEATATFRYVNGIVEKRSCNYAPGGSCSVDVPASVGGWGSSYTSTSCSSSTVTLTENTEYYECGVEVEIYLNAVGGSAASSYITRTFGDYYGGLPNATKDGYKFLGWYTEATGGSPVTSATKVTNYNDHTIYAHWAQGDDGSNICYKCSSNENILKWGNDANDNICSGGYVVSGISQASCGYNTITYNANNGSGAPSVQYQAINATIVLSSEVPTRSGYTFVGWSTNSSSVSAMYSPGSSYRGSGNITLYAVWLSNTCYKCSTNENILKWGSNANDSICSGGYVASSTSKSNCGYYSITYNANNGSGAPGVQYQAINATIALSSKAPTRSGYTFVGWNTDSSATTAMYSPGGSYRGSGNAVLYAIWKKKSGSNSGDSGGSDDSGVDVEKIEYIVRYDANGGSGSMADSVHVYGISKNLNTNAYIRTDYLFVNWNTSADGTGISYTDGQSVKDLTSVNGDIIILYAQWKANDSSDDGSGDSGEDNEITYSVRYNANGGIGTMDDSTHTYGIASNLSDNKFVKIGYEFVGWNTEVDGTGDNYTDGQTISNLSSTDGDVIDLYAQWFLKNDNENDNDDGNNNADDDDNGNNTGDNNSGVNNDNIDESPKTGSLATILVSMIGIGALGCFIYFRKKINI